MYPYNAWGVVRDLEEDKEKARCQGFAENNRYGFERWHMGSFNGSHFERKRLVDHLRGKKLKVITKLANIVLAPEKPSYRGGSWHVEGMLNERIVATGIYYYDQKNITESKHSFRQVFNPFKGFGLAEFASAAYGISNYEDEQCVQELGHVITKGGILLVVPNIFQHKVEPFELVDKTGPGHSEMLVFFLCDPYDDHIISTASVLPQQG